GGRVRAGPRASPRYFQATAPAILVLLAIGATPRAGWLRLARVAGVAVGLLLAMGTALHLAEPGHGREDVAAARAWLDANVAPEQPLLVTSSEMADLASFHWAPRPIVVYPTPPAVGDGGAAGDRAGTTPRR